MINFFYALLTLESVVYVLTETRTSDRRSRQTIEGPENARKQTQSACARNPTAVRSRARVSGSVRQKLAEREFPRGGGPPRPYGSRGTAAVEPDSRAELLGWPLRPCTRGVLLLSLLLPQQVRGRFGLSDELPEVRATVRVRG